MYPFWYELTFGFMFLQPNYELLDKEVEKRKMALQEAKLKAKGLNPDGTPALSTLGGFSPASKPCKFYLLMVAILTTCSHNRLQILCFLIIYCFKSYCNDFVTGSDLVVKYLCSETY